MSADVYSRLNYLYHAIETLSKNLSDNIALIHYYCKSFREITQKKVLRIDPLIRRRICYKCKILLVPGATATVRVRSRRQKHKVITCQFCGEIKRFNTKNDPFAHISLDDKPFGSTDDNNMDQRNIYNGNSKNT